MKTRSSLLAASAVLSIWMLATFVAAQNPPAPTVDDVKAAKTESDVGARLLAERLYEPAAAHYRKAYDLAHKTSDLQKLAESYRGMGDLGAAHDAYGRLIAALGAVPTPALLGARKALAEVEAATGLLVVHSSADGAIVHVNERSVGVTPLATPTRIGIGPAHVEVTKDGFEPFETNVVIDPAHVASVDVMLVPASRTGHLSVRETHRTTADVLVDGQDVGPLPWEGDVAPGVHEVTLQSPRVTADPQSIKVRAGARVEAVFAATFTAGHLHVTTNLPAAAIELDGKPVSVGTYDDDVPVGSHTLRVSAPGYRAVDREVSIAAQTTEGVRIVMERWVSPEEAAAEQARRDAAALVGGYGSVTLYGTYPLSAAHVDCSAISGPASCTTNTPLSGGLAVRGGYSFGMIGVELIGIFLGETWTDTVQYQGGAAVPTNASQVNHQESYQFSSAGGMIALGPRFATPGRNVRFSAGVAGGVAIRDFNLSRQVSGGISDDGTYGGHQLVVSPGLTADLGVVLGSTPGSSFTIGAMLWADFPGSPRSLSSSTIGETDDVHQFQTVVGPVTFEKSPQVYVGPFLGVRFGH